MNNLLILETKRSLQDKDLERVAAIHRRLLRLREGEYNDRFVTPPPEIWEDWQIVEVEDLRGYYTNSQILDTLRRYGIYHGWSFDYLMVYLCDAVLLELKQYDYVQRYNINYELYRLSKLLILSNDLTEDEFYERYSIVACNKDYMSYETAMRLFTVRSSSVPEIVKQLKIYGIFHRIPVDVILSNLACEVTDKVWKIKKYYSRHLKLTQDLGCQKEVLR